jgi:hypothetical protein
VTVELLDVGFTGTQNGMTVVQGVVVAGTLHWINMRSFHHGDCVGADDQAHYFVAGRTDVEIVIHPPLDVRRRAMCDRGLGRLIVRQPKEFLERDRDIVDETGCLVAAPRTFVDVTRSGTWYTVRYALRTQKPVTIVFPDGRVLTPRTLADLPRSR